MAQGKTIVEAQRGIAFSTISAFLVSELILIIGAGYHSQLNGQNFKIQLLAQFIEPYVGKVPIPTTYLSNLGLVASVLRPEAEL